MIWSKTRKQSRKLWVQHHPPPQSQGYISVRQVFITTGTASWDISFTYHNKNSSFTSPYNTITPVALQHDTTLILSVNGIQPRAKQQPDFHMLGRELRFDVTNPFKRLSTLWTRCPKSKTYSPLSWHEHKSKRINKPLSPKELNGYVEFKWGWEWNSAYLYQQRHNFFEPSASGERNLITAIPPLTLAGTLIRSHQVLISRNFVFVEWLPSTLNWEWPW